MLYHGLSIMLAPVLILQGLKVRRTTPRLAEPEGERVGQTGPNPTLKLLILGDSAAAGVGVTNQSEALLGQILKLLSPKVDVNYALFAKTGATTSSTLQALNEPVECSHPILGQTHFDVIVTSLGVNDIITLLKQWHLNPVREAFVQDVLNARPQIDLSNENVLSGKTYFGIATPDLKGAIEVGLADGEASLRDAIKEVYSLANYI